MRTLRNYWKGPTRASTARAHVSVLEHEFREMPESIHTKDESKRGTAFAFIFGVN